MTRAAEWHYAAAITMEQWHAQFEGLEGAPADERYVYHVLDFCEGAIRDAITLEDGLDAAAGEAVLRMIAAAKAQRAAPPTGTGKPADAEIDAIEDCARMVTVAMQCEDAALVARDRLLHELTVRLIAETNPLTGKPHSATSAEAAAKLTDDYLAAQALRQDAEREKVLAVARYEAQLRRATLAVGGR